MERHYRDFSFFQLIDRSAFDALVETHQMDKWVRSFSTWEFTCALITAVTLRLGSYREIEATLGIPRSTLGDAMNERFHGFFQDLCDLILREIRGQTRDRKVRRAIREILAIDSTECRVHGSIFASLPNWKQRQTHGISASCKIHVVYDINGEWIDDFRVTAGRRNDSPVSLGFKLLAGKTYVFDRAYNDMDFWLKILDSDSQIVSRLKECRSRRQMMREILSKRSNQTRSGVLWEGIYAPSSVQLHRYKTRLKDMKRFRHIIYRDPETKKIFHFISSDRESSAQTIANIYKRRWAIELLFRWIKGHVDNIRYLPVKSSNAVKTQISAAILVQLLLQLKRLKTVFPGSPWELLRRIRSNILRTALSGSGAGRHGRSLTPDGCRWTGPPDRSLQGVLV